MTRELRHFLVSLVLAIILGALTIYSRNARIWPILLIGLLLAIVDVLRAFINVVRPVHEEEDEALG